MPKTTISAKILATTTLKRQSSGNLPQPESALGNLRSCLKGEQETLNLSCSSTIADDDVFLHFLTIQWYLCLHVHDIFVVNCGQFTACDIKGINMSNSGMQMMSKNSYVGNAVAPEMEDHKTRFTISPSF